MPHRAPPKSPPAHRRSLSPQDKDSDIAGLTQRAEALEAELQDISCQESKDEASLAKVKKQLRDLEAKVKDQEEELDEQAGTIQMLEQVRRGGARARPPRVRVGFWAGWFRAGLSLPGPGLPGERRRPPSPRRQARLRLRTQLPALGAATMARQVTTGRAARSAEEQGVYWVSRAAV